MFPVTTNFGSVRLRSNWCLQFLSIDNGNAGNLGIIFGRTAASTLHQGRESLYQLSLIFNSRQWVLPLNTKTVYAQGHQYQQLEHATGSTDEATAITVPNIPQPTTWKMHNRAELLLSSHNFLMSPLQFGKSSWVCYSDHQNLYRTSERSDLQSSPLLAGNDCFVSQLASCLSHAVLLELQVQQYIVWLMTSWHFQLEAHCSVKWLDCMQAVLTKLFFPYRIHTLLRWQRLKFPACM